MGSYMPIIPESPTWGKAPLFPPVEPRHHVDSLPHKKHAVKLYFDVRYVSQVMATFFLTGNYRIVPSPHMISSIFPCGDVGDVHRFISFAFQCHSVAASQMLTLSHSSTDRRLLLALMFQYVTCNG